MATLTIKNISGVAKDLVGHLAVAHNGTFSFNTMHNEHLMPELQALAAAGTIQLLAGTLASGEVVECFVDIDATADVTGGGTTAVVGLQVKTLDGVALEKACVLTFGVYDDTNGVTAGAHATLDTATAGTILGGAGTNVLTVVTDSHGKFTCTMTNASDETVYLKAGTRVGSIMADISDVDSVTFSA